MTEAFARARPAAACCSTTTSRRRVSSRRTIRRCSAWPSLARQELATLVGRVDLALGVSEYNRRELEALGFAPTGVLPLAVDTVAHHAGRPSGRRSSGSWTTSS